MAFCSTEGNLCKSSFVAPMVFMTIIVGTHETRIFEYKSNMEIKIMSNEKIEWKKLKQAAFRAAILETNRFLSMEPREDEIKNLKKALITLLDSK